MSECTGLNQWHWIYKPWFDLTFIIANISIITVKWMINAGGIFQLPAGQADGGLKEGDAIIREGAIFEGNKEFANGQGSNIGWLVSTQANFGRLGKRARCNFGYIHYT